MKGEVIQECIACCGRIRARMRDDRLVVRHKLRNQIVALRSAGTVVTVDCPAPAAAGCKAGACPSGETASGAIRIGSQKNVAAGGRDRAVQQCDAPVAIQNLNARAGLHIPDLRYAIAGVIERNATRYASAAGLQTLRDDSICL